MRRTHESFALEPGDLVTLTGEMNRPRDVVEAEIRARGCRTHGVVTKKVKLVVAADPDSLSGKARKARDYGIPIVGETWFDRLLSEWPGNMASHPDPALITEEDRSASTACISR